MSGGITASDILQLKEVLNRINEVVREFEVKCGKGILSVMRLTSWLRSRTY